MHRIAESSPDHKEVQVPAARLPLRKRTVPLQSAEPSAKGGIAVTIADEFNMPIKYIGVGEGIEDLKEFVPEEFIGGIFDE